MDIFKFLQNKCDFVIGIVTYKGLWCKCMEYVVYYIG